MNDKVASYRRILKSSSIIGGASVINILIGLIRTKLVAVLLGPTGIGLVSLYTSLMSTASTVATMGIGTIGTRQIAQALGQDDGRALHLARRAMFWGSLLLASAGALVVWSLRAVLAVRVLGIAEDANLVGWLSLGVAFSVASASQGALIQGMRRIGDMARLSVYSSILNTVLGVALLWQLGQAGLLAYVLVGPLSSFVLGHWYVSRLPKVAACTISMKEIAHQWQSLLRLGVPFMGAGLVGALVQLWIRVKVGNTLGAESLGHFQAAWTISMQYIGFVLGAMGADYYPRLTGVIHDSKAATNLINEQTEIALLLSAPVFIAMIGFTPWVIHLLYSDAFIPAIEVLRWQILGDILKVASWPLGFVILAAGNGKVFFFVEAVTTILMGWVITVFISTVGLKITGIAFLASYVVLLPLAYFFAKRRIDFQWRASLIRLFVFVFVFCLVVLILCIQYWWGVIVCGVVSVGFAFYSVVRLINVSNFHYPMGRMEVLMRKMAGIIGVKIEQKY